MSKTFPLPANQKKNEPSHVCRAKSISNISNKLHQLQNTSNHVKSKKVKVKSSATEMADLSLKLNKTSSYLLGEVLHSFLLQIICPDLLILFLYVKSLILRVKCQKNQALIVIPQSTRKFFDLLILKIHNKVNKLNTVSSCTSSAINL